MDFDSKKAYIEGIQKDLSRSCFSRCFSVNDKNLDKSCIDNCYEKYIRTVGKVMNCYRDLAYENESMYGYVIFDMISPRYQIFVKRNVLPVVDQSKTYIVEKDDVNKKSV